MPYPKSIFGALFAVQILFGLNFVASKYVLLQVAPLQWAFLRLLCAGIILLFYCLFSGRKHPKINWDFIFPLIYLSFFGVFLNQGAFLYGLQWTSATNASILTTTIPLMTLLLSFLMKKERPRAIQLCGFLLGFLGVLILQDWNRALALEESFIGDLFILLNCFSFALFLSLGRDFNRKFDRAWSTTWMLLISAMCFLPFCDREALFLRLETFDLRLFLSMIYCILGATVFTYFLNNWALAKAKASTVAFFIYLQPVLASFIAFFTLGESMTFVKVVSLFLIFMGMYLSVQTKLPKRH